MGRELLGIGAQAGVVKVTVCTGARGCDWERERFGKGSRRTDVVS